MQLTFFIKRAKHNMQNPLILVKTDNECIGNANHIFKCVALTNTIQYLDADIILCGLPEKVHIQ